MRLWRRPREKKPRSGILLTTGGRLSTMKTSARTKEFRMKRPLSILVIAVAAATAGCAPQSFRVGNPWDPSEARFFDDGVDMVKDLKSLSGKWGFDHEQEFDGRVQLADLIAQVMVLSVQTLSDIDGVKVKAKRIYLKVLHSYYGAAPEQKFYLVSATDAPGYEFLGRYERHLGGRFTAFIRWYEDADGARRHHFHISPDAPAIREEVEKRVAARKAEEEAAALRAQKY
jgi:hypothetical protein